MLLQKENSEARVNIKSYQTGEVKLNIGAFHDVILLVNGDKSDFHGAKSFKDLQFEHLTPHIKAKPEILIIGTGEKHQMIPPLMTQKINSMGIAVEAMASRQACHTYQVLMYEQRVVYALIYP